MTTEEVGLYGAIAAGFTFLGALVQKAYERFVAGKKADGDQFDKTTSLQREIIADLRSDMTRLSTLLQGIEKERLDCRVENATLKAEIASLKFRLEEIESRLPSEQ